jgi:hypothetical protein
VCRGWAFLLRFGRAVVVARNGAVEEPNKQLIPSPCGYEHGRHDLVWSMYSSPLQDYLSLAHFFYGSERWLTRTEQATVAPFSISVILWACCAARPVGREQGDKNGLTPGPIPVRSCCFFQLQQAMLCFPLTQLLLILFMPRFLQYKTGASGLTPTGHLISKIEKKIKG